MFDQDFYPTPKEIVLKMIEPFKQTFDNGRYKVEHYGFKDKYILEPSAGKGDILDAVSEACRHSDDGRLKLHAIEKDDELAATLRGKYYKVIGSDFLEYKGNEYAFDLILMNPPFSDGDKHLLHAWEILESGDIVCLLNAETIKNPYTETRKLLQKIITDNGSVEFIGQAFQDAERKTDVEVALVRLKKTAVKDRFDFSGMNDKEELNFATEETGGGMIPHVPMSTIRSIVLQYEQTKLEFLDALQKLSKMEKDLEFLTGGAGIELHKELNRYGSSKEKFHGFLDTAKMAIWRNIIRKLNIRQYMTSDLERNFERFIAEQGNMAITEENIKAFLRLIFENREMIMEQAIAEVFDEFTKYHKENRCHIEGWKTNDCWKVNKKVILPHWVKYGGYMNASDLKTYGDQFRTEYDGRMSDVDKALCYITGKNFDEIRTIYQALNYHFDRLGRVRTGDQFDNETESHFFKIKFWKKGTVHIEFKDEALWREFNMRACAFKNWLPPAEKKAWEEEKARKNEPAEELEIEMPEIETSDDSEKTIWEQLALY